MLNPVDWTPDLAMCNYKARPDVFTETMLFVVTLILSLASILAAQTPNPITIGDIGPQPRSPDRPKIEGHWGEDAVGVPWEESDSVDGRWNETEIGPHLASVLPTPTGTIAKGLSIRLYDHEQPVGAVGYDTHSMTCRVAWTGAFLKFDPARYGIISAPTMDGPPMFSQSRDSWGEADVQYRGLFQNGRTIVLQYEVNGTRVWEMPSLILRNGQPALRRDFEMSAADADTILYLPSQSRVLGEANEVALETVGDAPQVRVPPHTSLVRFATLTGLGDTNFERESPPADLSTRSAPGPLLWPELLQTVGVVAPDDGPLVIDTITLPFENPYRALLFIGGHDFLADGRAATCTLHGDVWIIDGLDRDLRNVTWKRFATGLHQPLGLRIVDDTIYVLGRDQITRLHDRDQNGEADYYECFNNDGVTSVGGHDFAAGLETDSDGDFYYIRAHTGVMKVAKDGSSEQSIAAGLRNPAGLSVGPADVVVASPQEGEWTPASAVFEVKPGGWYGYGGPKVTPQRPSGYDPPLCWTPRLVDNSTGGQVWVTSDRWGPLQDQLLTLSFGRCTMMLTLRDNVVGVAQGGNVPLNLRFESGVMRGRFHPLDGQLYVSGLNGWVTSATRDGCFQRVRYTGQPLNLPVKLQVYENGLALLFSDSLDPRSVHDIENFHVQQWNYRYSSAYGSDEFRVSPSKQPGRDEVELQSVSLSDDGRTVLLEIADVKPVMQMKVSYTLKSADGEPVQNSVYHTINVVPGRRLTPRTVEVAAVTRSGRLDREVRKRLKPGLVARFRRLDKTGPVTDVRHSRLAAIAIPASEPASSLLGVGAYDFSLSGYLRSQLRGDVRFWQDGPSDVTLKINDEVIEVGQWDPNAVREGKTAVEQPKAAPLSRGYNRMEVTGNVSDGQECRFRLMWSSDDVLPEPIPAKAMFYDGENRELESADELREARERFATLQCNRCHAIPRPPATEVAMPELAFSAPRLTDLGQRLRPEWVAHWLLEPRSLRRQATMPHVLTNTDSGQQDATDLTAFLVRDAANFSDAKRESVESPDADDEKLEVGLELYETRGCMACHRFTPPTAVDEHDRISLHFANAKFRSGELAAFLREPHRHNAAIRMPDFGLEENEAAAISAYVRSQSEGTLTALVGSAADPNRGRDLFSQRRCNQCHALDDEPLPVAPFGTLFNSPNLRGCLAADEALRGTAPDFGFNDQQRQGLLRFLRTGDQSLRSRCQVEMAARLMGRLRCLSCHDRDESYSPLADILAEDGELGYEYERLPNLGLAGEKLKTDWLQRQLAGALRYRSRPWLRTRMPAFPAYAGLIPASLAAEHGLATTGLTQDVEPSSELVAIGVQLSTKAKGFDCLQCHSLDDKFLVLENKANGVGLSYVTDRLRKAFYHRWIRDPLRIDPLTKMPKFTEDGIRSQRKEYFDGDARQQFEALWQYMRSLESKRED